VFVGGGHINLTRTKRFVIPDSMRDP